MFSSCSLISEFSYPFTNSLVTVPKAHNTIAVIIFFVFDVFFLSLARSRYLLLFLLSFRLTLWSERMVKPTIRHVHSLLTFTRSGRLVMIRWSVLSQNPRETCVSNSLGDSGLCIFYLFNIVKLQFLPKFSVDHFPDLVVSIFILFCANFLHFLIVVDCFVSITI